VPEAARTRIVGDYHTHGGPNPIADGEDFSGYHYGSVGTSDSDIVEAREDLERYRANILTDKNLGQARFTSFLGTPSGRFAVHNPALGSVFSFSPSPGLLPSDQTIPAASYAFH
jgi:hypothetical protein